MVLARTLQQTPTETKSWAPVMRSSTDVPEVDVRWVAAYGQRYRLVDVRNLDDYAGQMGHIDGAELIPISALEQLVQEWPLNEQIILLCNDGYLAGEAAKMLEAMGYSQAVAMRGGMKEWHRQSQPVSYRC